MAARSPAIRLSRPASPDRGVCSRRGASAGSTSAPVVKAQVRRTSRRESPTSASTGFDSDTPECYCSSAGRTRSTATPASVRARALLLVQTKPPGGTGSLRLLLARRLSPERLRTVPFLLDRRSLDGGAVVLTALAGGSRWLRWLCAGLVAVVHYRGDAEPDTEQRQCGTDDGRWRREAAVARSDDRRDRVYCVAHDSYP
jgi:hypothetical protein